MMTPRVSCMPDDLLADAPEGAAPVGGVETPVPEDEEVIRVVGGDPDVGELPTINAKDVEEVVLVHFSP